MSARLLLVDGAEVPGKGAKGTVLNITVTQESWLACLLKALAARRERKPPPKPADPAPGAGAQGSGGGQQALGAAQALLGLVCGSLGVAISLDGAPSRVTWTGAPFWMGSLFILSGIFSVVGERRGGSWVVVATFFNLASMVAGIVGLVKGVADIPSLHYSPSSFDYICKPGSERPWWATPTPTPVYDWRVAECKHTLAGFSVMAAIVHLLLLIYSIVALIISLLSLGFGLRTLCCSLRLFCTDCSRAYVALGDPEEPLASENPVV